MTHARTVDSRLYSSRALAEAREAYALYCSVRAAPDEHGRVAITVQVKPAGEADARAVVLEFWNYYLNASCKKRLEADPE